MSEQPPAGWYESPPGSGTLRYWNGDAWTEQTYQPEASQQPSSSPQPAQRGKSNTAVGHRSPRRKKHFGPGWRKMTWALIIWTVLIAAWIIGGISSTNSSSYCQSHRSQYLSVHACEEARNVGAGIGVGVLIFLWFVVFVILSLIWFMTRPKGRICPVCGERVKKGQTVCPACGHDFAVAAGDTPRPA